MRIDTYSLGFNMRRKMTRSAPPERNVHSKTTSGTARNSSAHPPAQRAKSALSSLNIEDIYQFAERERLNYSTASRRQILAHAQSQTQFFRHEQTTRPNTSASQHMNASARELNTPVSAWSEPLVSRPSSTVAHPEIRELLDNGQPADQEEYSDEEYGYLSHNTPINTTFSPVGRDCCEIMGPQLCYECRKNRIRQVSRQKSDMFFPTLDPTEDNLTTTAVVRKYLPGLSEPEIESKLIRGEIARPTMIRKQNRLAEFSDEEEANEPKSRKHTNKKVTIAEHSKETRDNATRLTQQKPSELFFMNIQHLNSKIITGDVDRNVGFPAAARKVTPKKKISSLKKNLFPTFVSPRKVIMVQETNYKTYFDPPLIDKAKQDVEPAFFAGSKNEYTLPEKLPDELVFVDKTGKTVKASSSPGFTDKVTVAGETATKKNGKVKTPAVRRTAETGISKSGTVDPLGSLQENDEEEEEAETEVEDKITEGDNVTSEAVDDDTTVAETLEGEETDDNESDDDDDDDDDSHTRLSSENSDAKDDALESEDSIDNDDNSDYVDNAENKPILDTEAEREVDTRVGSPQVKVTDNIGGASETQSKGDNTQFISDTGAVSRLKIVRKKCHH